MAHGFACMVCGSKLTYGEKAVQQECYYCNKITISPISCPSGHFVCDSCHSSDALDLLRTMAEDSDMKDPREIVEAAFSHPSFKFHGPEHHSLVPAAILLAMKNQGVPKIDGEEITSQDILEGIRRGSKIPGGFCGYAGSCGACVGAGIAVAIFLTSTPTKGPERSSAHSVTIDAMGRVQDELIRCCKRSTLYGIAAAMDYLEKQHDIHLGEIPQPKSCTNWERNQDCATEECIFYGGDAIRQS